MAKKKAVTKKKAKSKKKTAGRVSKADKFKIIRKNLIGLAVYSNIGEGDLVGQIVDVDQDSEGVFLTMKSDQPKVAKDPNQEEMSEAGSDDDLQESGDAGGFDDDELLDEEFDS